MIIRAIKSIVSHFEQIRVREEYVQYLQSEFKVPELTARYMLRNDPQSMQAFFCR